MSVDGDEEGGLGGRGNERSVLVRRGGGLRAEQTKYLRVLGRLLQQERVDVV